VCGVYPSVIDLCALELIVSHAAHLHFPSIFLISHRRKSDKTIAIVKTYSREIASCNYGCSLEEIIADAAASLN